MVGGGPSPVLTVPSPTRTLTPTLILIVTQLRRSLALRRAVT